MTAPARDRQPERWTDSRLVARWRAQQSHAGREAPTRRDRRGRWWQRYLRLLVVPRRPCGAARGRALPGEPEVAQELDGAHREDGGIISPVARQHADVPAQLQPVRQDRANADLDDAVVPPRERDRRRSRRRPDRRPDRSRSVGNRRTAPRAPSRPARSESASRPPRARCRPAAVASPPRLNWWTARSRRAACGRRRRGRRLASGGHQQPDPEGARAGCDHGDWRIARACSR